MNVYSNVPDDHKEMSMLLGVQELCVVHSSCQTVRNAHSRQDPTIQTALSSTLCFDSMTIRRKRFQGIGFGPVWEGHKVDCVLEGGSLDKWKSLVVGHCTGLYSSPQGGWHAPLRNKASALLVSLQRIVLELCYIRSASQAAVHNAALNSRTSAGVPAATHYRASSEA